MNPAVTDYQLGWDAAAKAYKADIERLTAELADALQVCGGNLQAGLAMKAERDRLRDEREAYRSLAGIGLNGTDEADELAKITPVWERDAEAYRRIQERVLAAMGSVRKAWEPRVDRLRAALERIDAIDSGHPWGTAAQMLRDVVRIAREALAGVHNHTEGER